jgi:hypothetical protein
MHILLKNLIKEAEEKSPLKIQFYCDMDGVLVDLDKGFKQISGGLSPKDYEQKNGKNSFWKVINQKDPATGKTKYPNFWLDLEPMPDAFILWDFIKNNFKNPVPVILTAGQGSTIQEQKTQWIRKYIDPKIKVILASAGIKKPNYILQYPPTEKISHLLLDDTDKNILAWNNSDLHRIAIHHSDAASSIEKLKPFIQ